MTCFVHFKSFIAKYYKKISLVLVLNNECPSGDRYMNKQIFREFGDIL